MFGLFISVSLSLIVLLLLQAMTGPKFDSSKGPRGSSPSEYPTSPLPVFNVIQETDTKGIYLGTAIDWVSFL
jgi:hypothetical protein